MNLVKIRFLREGKPNGREYTYISKERVEVGDTVIVRKPDSPDKEAPKGVVTEIDVPESAVESFKDKLKEIVGKVEAKCEDCENLVACGEGDHVCLECGEEPAFVISSYSPTDDYLKCKGTKYR